MSSPDEMALIESGDVTPAARPSVVVFDVGRVLVEWDLRHLFAQMIGDKDELEWFVGNVVTEEWHFQHDAGRPLADMVPERQAQFPAYADHIAAYATRFNETVPGAVQGTHALVAQLAIRNVPLYAITNFGAEFWQDFLPQWPVMRHFSDIVVSGVEKLTKPDAAIFELAARRFGYRPDQMLFIDDNPANIATARGLGWHTHHFVEGADALAADLVAHGLIHR